MRRAPSRSTVSWFNLAVTFDEAVARGSDALKAGQLDVAQQQYRAALALYRKALAVDPKHKPSLDEKQKIDDIYKGMPGGIPK